jgi:hypothetical protein
LELRAKSRDWELKEVVEEEARVYEEADVEEKSAV